MTDAGGYNLVAFLTGVVALLALALALWAWPRLVPALLGVAVAFAAFSLTVYVSGIFVLARVQGEIWVYGGWSYAGTMGRNWTPYPAKGPFLFAATALVGAMATLGLGGTWLRRARGTRPVATRPVPSAPSAVAR